MTKRQLQRIANSLTRRLNLTHVDVRLQALYHGGYYVRGENSIVIGRWGKQYHVDTLLHEVAHHVQVSRGLLGVGAAMMAALVDQTYAHDDRFCRILKEVCSLHYGPRWRSHYQGTEYQNVIEFLKLPDKIKPFKCNKCSFHTTSRKKMMHHLIKEPFHYWGVLCAKA